MSRPSLLIAVSATTWCTAVLTTFPGGIPEAEGCSGASGATYAAPGWSQASWAVDPTGVPTDGAVRLKMGADYSPVLSPGGADAGAGATITVLAPDQSTVQGSPASMDAPPTKEAGGGKVLDPNTIITWRPSAPFQPSATYTLRIEGLLGNPVELTFTTGSGAFEPPKPVLANPSLSISRALTSGPQIACSYVFNGSCHGESHAQQMIAPAAEIHAELDVDEPVAAARTFITPELQASSNDGPFVDHPGSSAVFPFVTGKICVRVVATNELTQASTASPAWCTTTDGLDLAPVPNCQEMAKVLSDCSSAPGATLSPGARDVHQAVCGGAPEQEGGCAVGRAGAGAGTGMYAMILGLLAGVRLARK